MFTGRFVRKVKLAEHHFVVPPQSARGAAAAVAAANARETALATVAMCWLIVLLTCTTALAYMPRARAAWYMMALASAFESGDRGDQVSLLMWLVTPPPTAVTTQSPHAWTHAATIRLVTLARKLGLKL